LDWFEPEMAETAASWSSQRGRWFNAPALIYCHREARSL
jgi:hypothetical protein